MLKALRARRKPQDTGRFLKVHRSLVYRLKKVLDQDAEEADVTPARKEHIFPASVMVLGVISSKGDVMPPTPSLTRGQRVHAKQYIEVLDTVVVKPWMETVARECPYVFQQDRALPTQLKSPRPV